MKEMKHLLLAHQDLPSTRSPNSTILYLQSIQDHPSEIDSIPYTHIVLFCVCTFALQIEINYKAPRWICVVISYIYIYCLLTFYIYTPAVTNFSFMVTVYSKVHECICLI